MNIDDRINKLKKQMITLNARNEELMQLEKELIAQKYAQIITAYNEKNQCHCKWDSVFEITSEMLNYVGKNFDGLLYARIVRFNQHDVYVAPCSQSGKSYGFVEVIPVELVLDAIRQTK